MFKHINIHNNASGKTMVFKVKNEQLQEAISFIKYNDGILKNEIYIFKNPINFQIIDLYLSTIATPQPYNATSIIA